MRRNSNRSTHRTRHSDILDELDNESRHTRNEPIPPIRQDTPVKRLKVLDDRRHWAPGSLREADPKQRVAPRAFSGRTARISHQPKKAFQVRRGPNGKPLASRKSVWTYVDRALPRFAEARKTVICFKRKVRREVLHALKLKHSGKGSRKKRNEWSDVQC